MQNRLTMRRDGSHAWLLYGDAAGAEFGGIEYRHAADGNHYQPWRLVHGARQLVGDPLPQLAMAARALEKVRRDAVASQ